MAVRTHSNTELEGLLLLDKPPAWTSHDVVAKLRGVFGIRKIGHAGTLDPMATGLLIILIGKATKASNFLMSLDKTYRGTFQLGVETDSQDADGEVTAEHPVPPIETETLRAAMEAMLGDQYQIPPMFSAKKIKGVPLYKLARKGQEVEREPRFVRISRFQLLAFQTPEVTFEMDVSKGTYVRTVAHDLGKTLGCGAHLTSLQRTRIDRFELDQAYTIEQLEAVPQAQLGRFLIPIHRAVPSHVL